MDVFECIKTRRSIRKFLPDPVKEEDLNKILDAARWAPSAGNLQPWEFIVVRDPERKEAIARAALNQRFIAEAPVVIVVCANIPRTASRYGERGETLYCIQDTAAATQNMLLAAHALGYGTCWVGAFREEEVKRILNIPPDVRPVAIIPLGKPAEQPPPRGRYPLEEVVHYEEYGRKTP
ncbi:MAG: nitroreductase family protein [Candidatus Njordarchaeales archaeon]